MKPVNRQSLVEAAMAMAGAGERFALLGGSVVPVLLDNPELATVRPTKDVDVIVEVLTHIEYTRLEARLRELGFRHDMSQGAPKCRWLLGEITVDVMPVSEQASGQPSKWFAEALEAAVPVEVIDGESVDIVTAPFLIATKLEAFADRGEDDYYGSHDLEDIITLLDGRSALVQEIMDSPRELTAYLAERFRGLLEKPDFGQSLSGHFPSDPASQQRVLMLLKTIADIAALAE